MLRQTSQLLPKSAPFDPAFADSASAFILGNRLLAETKARLIDSIQNDISNGLSFTFVARDKCIKIVASQNAGRKEETVPLDKIKTYLMEAQSDFFAQNSMEKFEESYFFLRKSSALIKFFQKKTMRSGLEKEIVICLLNEIVFLIAHGVVSKVFAGFEEAFSLLKLQCPKTKVLSPNFSIFSNKSEFFESFKKKIYKGKVHLRLLLASCLFQSELGSHEKSISQAHSALYTIIDLIRMSRMIILFYLSKHVLSFKSGKTDKKKDSLHLKIFYFSHIFVILDSLLKKVELFSPVNPLKSSERYCNFFLEVLKRENFEFPQIDYSMLNNPSILNNLYLCESTIYSLAQMNFFNFEDEFVNNKLKSEFTEISILEKISFLVVTLYIISTENRFKEHQSSLKNPFSRVLFNFSENNAVKPSEVFLTKATEISFQFLSESFPFVSQIFSIFKKFELGRSKVIPESLEDPCEFIYLYRFKNGFKNDSIVPVVQNLNSNHIPKYVFESASKKGNEMNNSSSVNCLKENKCANNSEKVTVQEKKFVLKDPKPFQELVVKKVKKGEHIQKVYQTQAFSPEPPKTKIQNYIEDNARKNSPITPSTPSLSGEKKSRVTSSKMSKERVEQIKGRRASSSDNPKTNGKKHNNSAKLASVLPLKSLNEFSAAKTNDNFLRQKNQNSKQKKVNLNQDSAKLNQQKENITGWEFFKKASPFQSLNIHVNNIKTLNFIMNNDQKNNVKVSKNTVSMPPVKTSTIQELIKNIK